MEDLLKNLANLDEAIRNCLGRNHLLPALTLIYVGIDIVASLERHKMEATKASFTRWVESYIPSDKVSGCTAVDLYGARCGVLHTFTPDSDLSRKGRARKIYYAWGNASADDLKETASRLGKNDVIALHVDDLHRAFHEAVQKWTSEVMADADRRKRVAAASGTWFINMSTQVVKEFLRMKE